MSVIGVGIGIAIETKYYHCLCAENTDVLSEIVEAYRTFNRTAADRRA